MLECQTKLKSIAHLELFSDLAFSDVNYLVKELTWYVWAFNYMTRITNTKAEETSYPTHSRCSLVLLMNY